jgi:hypothetical protein
MTQPDRIADAAETPAPSARTVDRASQDAAMRILQASDLMSRRLREFEATLKADSPRAGLPPETEARLDRLEASLARIEARLADRDAPAPAASEAALAEMAAVVKLSFDALAGEFRTLKGRIEAAPPAPPAPAARALEGDDTFHAAIAALAETVGDAMKERQALSGIVERLDPERILQGCVRSLDMPLRRLSEDLAAIDVRLAAIEGRVEAASSAPPAPPPSALPDVATAGPRELFGPERANLQRMLVGFSLLLNRLNASVETFEGNAGRVAPPPTAAIEALEAVPGRVDALGARIETVAADVASVAAAMRESKAEGAGIAFEKAQLQQLILGFRMISIELAAEIDRIRGGGGAQGEAREAGFAADGAEVAAAAAEALAVADKRLAETGAAIGAALEAHSRRLETAARALATPPSSAEATPAAGAEGGAAVLLGEAIALLCGVSDTVEEARGDILRQVRAVRNDLARLPDHAPGPSDGTLGAIGALAASIDAAAQRLENDTAAFLSISAALGHELAALSPGQGTAAGKEAGRRRRR